MSLTALLVAALLLAALLYPACTVEDAHGRWQLLTVRFVAARQLLREVTTELAWDAAWLLLALGSKQRACQLDVAADGEDILREALQQTSGGFSGVALSESEDGQSYELSVSAPPMFSPSYRPTSSSPYAPARVLACSLPSRRCDVAVLDLFQADLRAETTDSAAASSDAVAHTAALPTFCATPERNASEAGCEQWPFSAFPTAESACGSGVLNMAESRQWWYYRHPMSCMQLARSIGSRHNYCAGRDPHVDESRVEFHIAMFGPQWRRQATLAVAAFLLTQNLSQSHLNIWTDRSWSALSGVDDVQPLLSAAAQHVQVRVWDALSELLASNTLLSGSAAWYASIDDSRGYLRGDLMRLLLLHNYGGVWLDADVLLLRDLSPLLGQQFFYKWGGHCDEFNGAVVRMFRRSALSSRFLDTLYHTPPLPNSVHWGNGLYTTLHAAQHASLAAQRSPPSTASLRSELFTVFPACFFNANWMEPAAFSPLLRPELPSLWPTLWHGPFAYHLHGEVWDDKGFAAQDPTYKHVAARIATLTQAKWKLEAK